MTYSVFMIGCGAIAGGYDADRSAENWPLTHAGAIARDDRFALAACFDRDEDAVEAFAARWDVPCPADRFAPMGPGPGDFDVIVIATPTDTHAQALEGALTMKPRAVFCEKPLAATAAQAQDIADRYAAADVLLGVNYTRRWAPDLVEIAQQIKRGEWGDLIAASGIYTKGIVHNGSHLVDLLHMLIGPLSLAAVGPARHDHWPDDPTVSAILTATNGAHVHLVAGDARAVTQFELALSFTHGEIAMRDAGMRMVTRRVDDSATFANYRELSAPVNVPGRYSEAMSRAYANLAGALAGEEILASTAETALPAQRLCEEIRSRALAPYQKDPA